MITSALFVLPLRDDTPHVPNEDLGEEAVLDIVRNLTHIINQVFPSKHEAKMHHHTKEINVYCRVCLFFMDSFTLLMKSLHLPCFVDTKVYSALGNHDYHPKNQLPAAQSYIYEQIAKMWQDWLDPESQNTFNKG